MAGKYLWITLFVTIQISITLCRNTEKPHGEDHDKDYGEESMIKSIGLSEMGKLLEASNFTDDTGNTIPKNAAVPNQMQYDVYDDRYYIKRYNNVVFSAAAITGIVIGVFTLCSLILGCILILCCKKEPRRGYIVNTGGQTSGMPQPGFVVQGTPGTNQRMQQYPTSYGQTQQQNVYPPTYPTK